MVLSWVLYPSYLEYLENNFYNLKHTKMKKSIFLFLTVLLIGCTPKLSCVLAQYPPQFVYAGQNCTAPIPDYKPFVSVAAGCTGFTLTQTPAVGFLLTASNKTQTVMITATGTNGKSSQIQFSVTLIDTVTPVITTTGLLIEDSRLFHLNKIQDAADKVAMSLFSEQNSGPSIDSLDNKLLVTISKKSIVPGERDHITRLAGSVVLDADSSVDWGDLKNLPSLLYYKDLDAIASYAASKIRYVVWDSIRNVPTAVKFAMDWRDLYDWLAFNDYNPIPKKDIVTPDLTRVKEGLEFAPLLLDKSEGKLKFWNDGAWHTITSN